MHIRRSEPSRLFITEEAGAGLNSELRCEHGAPSLSLHLYGRADGGPVEDLGVLLPMCRAQQLLGAVLAQVEVTQGRDAVDEFVAGLLAAKEEGVRVLEQRFAQHQAAQQACCEASVFTNGREHTCSTASQS
ncbi:hypothetical protein ACQEV9_18035 [Streptomyces chartreusis]|uniref:hypothetical protein n=1 Tax=Streptomyces chartreusis TaxID=1969 RepID=UPI003D8D1AF5